ncbi:MAG TPA: prepilin-type N-terminal cleavage/methylation domain-containing protein [Candidatus Saccharimonadales bacterium]|nr:prepilin-type N-terminal cleavage/methylation domain-containing protein [Candidatus Saccharimonadales bacterium]
MIRLESNGFTIVELMIATGILSVILLICATSLIDIGRTYNKGVISTQTQDATRAIMQDASNLVQFGSTIPKAGAPQSFNSLAEQSYCIGTTRYTFGKNAQVNDGLSAGTYNAQHQSLHALWRDTTTNPGLCPLVDLTASGDLSNAGNSGVPGSGQEMVPVNMRLKEFSINLLPVSGSKVYDIHVTVIYGNDADTVLTGGVATGCGNNIIGGSYCGISDLSTEVYRYL